MEGKFRARGKVATLCETKDGKTQVAVECAIPLDGGTIYRTWFGYFTEKTTDRTIESLRLFGWKGDDLSDLSGIDANEVELVIEEEEYPEGSGTIREKVQWVNRLGGGGVRAPLADDRVKSFAAQMKAKIREHDASAGKKAPAAKPPNGSAPASSAPAVEEKDLPF